MNKQEEERRIRKLMGQPTARSALQQAFMDALIFGEGEAEIPPPEIKRFGASDAKVGDIMQMEYPPKYRINIMNEAELLIVKEALQLAEQALAQLQTVNNPKVKIMANILHGVVVFGEMALG